MTLLHLARPALLAFASAAALYAAPALAQTDEAAPAMTVRYGDLDLNAPAGARAMLQRIDVAAADVCGGMPDIRDPGRLAAFDRCRTAAAHRAVSEVDAPLVSAAAHGAGLSTLARR